MRHDYADNDATNYKNIMLVLNSSKELLEFWNKLQIKISYIKI
jgi:hypothetical protein